MKPKTWKNVDALRTEHECDEHWNLRRSFLVAHREKFEKSQLKCLAQVFINVEILGCRYPKETMDLVSSLSSEIPEVQSYREKKEHKLKRTFVQASDAAETRAKGFKKSKTTTNLHQFVPATTSEAPPSIPDNPFENMVIVESKFSENSPHHSFATVERTLILNKFSVKDLYKITKLKNKNVECDVIWKGSVICSASSGESALEAKREAAGKFLKIMKNYCYTVEVLKQIDSSATIDTNITRPSKEDKSMAAVNKPVSAENKGSKMLRLMGWSGGGLGKDGQGIADPITAVQSVNRSGLGLEKLTMQQCKHKILKCLDEFIADETAFDLEFAADFTKDERKQIHEIVRRNSRLKTQSYGKDSERRLVVSKKERLHDMVARLKETGGSTSKHNLVWPLLAPKPS